MRAHVRFLLVASLASSACAGKNKNETEFEGLGKVGASSELQPGLFSPIEAGNLDALRQRGLLLHDMERSLRLAYERGVQDVGMGEGNVVLPLVDVDPGGRSAQVVFVRWDRAAAQAGLSADTAQRWLMVSLLLAPDRVLDVELLRGPVAKDGPEYRRVEDLLVAASHLRDLTPEQSYHLFCVDEQLATRNAAGTQRQTRVYALSDLGDGPDLELVVVRKKKRKAPSLLEAVRLHPHGAAQADPIEVATAYPGAATVARVLLRGPEAGEVEAHAVEGTFRISSRDGRVERVGAATGPADAPEAAGPDEAPAQDPTPEAAEPGSAPADDSDLQGSSPAAHAWLLTPTARLR